MTNPVLSAVCAIAVIIVGGWLGELAAYGDYAPTEDRLLVGALSAASLIVGGMMAAAAAKELKRG